MIGRNLPVGTDPTVDKYLVRWIADPRPPYGGGGLNLRLLRLLPA